MRTPAISLCLMLVACESGSAGPGDAGSGGTGGSPPDGGMLDPLEGIGMVELVQDGFIFTEGPTWRTASGTLLFSDIVGNAIYELTPPDSVEVFRPDSANANGLDSDADDLLLTAEHGNRRVSRTLADGMIVDVASTYQGDPLNSPNDIAARSDGTIYFTDPPFGILPDQQVLEFNGVFRVDAEGELTAEWEGALDTRPNGVVLSPDESVLYVAESASDMILAFDVSPSGALSGERTFVADVEGADGMAMDARGNLFAAALDGVRVYDPAGELWGTIEVPDDKIPANCAFGGNDARTLYITARSTLYQVVLANPGLY